MAIKIERIPTLDRCRRRSRRTTRIDAELSIAAETPLESAWPIPSHLLSAMIAAGAATVPCFAILSEFFLRKISDGPANASLSLLDVGGAFDLQSATLPHHRSDTRANGRGCARLRLQRPSWLR
jgi:hypothetical protein